MKNKVNKANLVINENQLKPCFEKITGYDAGYFKTWGTLLMYLLVYPYIVVFRHVPETF